MLGVVIAVPQSLGCLHVSLSPKTLVLCWWKKKKTPHPSLHYIWGQEACQATIVEICWSVSVSSLSLHLLS